MDSRSIRCARVIPPQTKGVAEGTQTESEFLTPWDIPEFGLPLLNPFGAEPAGGQKRRGANNRIRQPCVVHRFLPFTRLQPPPWEATWPVMDSAAARLPASSPRSG